MTWLERIEAEMVEVEPDLPEDILPKDAPDYINRIIVHLAESFAPTVPIKSGKTLGARQLGAAIGHKIAGVKAFADGLDVFQGRSASSADPLRSWLESIVVYLRSEYHAKVTRALRRCLAIACAQPLAEMREFFAGFEKALQVGTLTKDGKLVGAKTTLEFYVLVLCFGASLKQRFTSISQLHAFFREAVGQRAGDIKTTEKRCKRIGLSFARPKQ